MLFKEPLTEWFFVNQKWFFYGIAWIIFLFLSVQCWLFPIHYYLELKYEYKRLSVIHRQN